VIWDWPLKLFLLPAHRVIDGFMGHLWLSGRRPAAERPPYLIFQGYVGFETVQSWHGMWSEPSGFTWRKLDGCIFPFTCESWGVCSGTSCKCSGLYWLSSILCTPYQAEFIEKHCISRSPELHPPDMIFLTYPKSDRCNNISFFSILINNESNFDDLLDHINCPYRCMHAIFFPKKNRWPCTLVCDRRRCTS